MTCEHCVTEFYAGLIVIEPLVGPYMVCNNSSSPSSSLSPLVNPLGALQVSMRLCMPEALAQFKCVGELGLKGKPLGSAV